MKAQAALQRRVAEGTSDPVEGAQPPRPEFDGALVGKRMEVLWRYTDRDSGVGMLIWAPGRVVRVADGLADKRSKRHKNLLPAGAVLWAWDADPAFGEKAGEQWLVLLPGKYNKQVHYGWRFDPAEWEGEGSSDEPGAKRPRNVQRDSQ